MSSFTITGVGDNVREWNSEKGGPMKSYRVVMTDDAGNATPNVEWARKATSPAPTVGQKVEGEIDTSGQYGPKFKAAQQGGGGGGGGYRPRPPEETAQIQRQHSQEMALRYCAIKAALGQLPAEFKPDEHLRPIVDWFDRDLAEVKRRVLAGEPHPPIPQQRPQGGQ